MAVGGSDATRDTGFGGYVPDGLRSDSEIGEDGDDGCRWQGRADADSVMIWTVTLDSLGIRSG